MNLLISLRAEILKTKRTAAIYLTIAAAAFGPLMSLLDILIGEGISAGDRSNIFNNLFVQKFQMTSLVALPIFLILICTLLPQIEYKNNAWKQVLTSPKTKANIFVSKFINVQLLLLVFIILNLLFMLICAVVLHFKHPSLHVLEQPLHGYEILISRLNAYGVLLAICSIQFWLGLRFKNFIIPIAIGILCWFAGTLLVMPIKSGFAEYFPYSFHVYVSLPDFKLQINSILFTSFVYAALFFLIGFLDFRSRKMHG